MSGTGSNKRAPLDAAVAFCLYSGGHCRRASEPGRSATEAECAT
jgi:hypothetical protein